MSTLKSKFLAAGGVLALAAALGAGTAVTASAAPVHYVKDGTYQFASDSAGSFLITGNPQAGSEALGAGGVELTSDSSAGSGVIVNLGTLGSLFPGGTYAAPSVGGSPDLAVNFYFGTNGSTAGYGTVSASGVWTGADGDNYASMGAASGTLDSADFGTFASEPGTDTAFTRLGSGTLTMAQVKAAYAAGDGSEGVATADPEVWAWIGISGTATGHVTSVDGRALVKAENAPAPKPKVTAGAGDFANAFGNGPDVWQQKFTAGALVRGWTVTATDPATKWTVIGGSLKGTFELEAFDGNGEYASGLCLERNSASDAQLSICAHEAAQELTYDSTDGHVLNGGDILTPDGTGGILSFTVTGAAWAGGSDYRWHSLPA